MLWNNVGINFTIMQVVYVDLFAVMTLLLGGALAFYG